MLLSGPAGGEVPKPLPVTVTVGEEPGQHPLLPLNAIEVITGPQPGADGSCEQMFGCGGVDPSGGNVHSPEHFGDPQSSVHDVSSVTPMSHGDVGVLVHEFVTFWWSFEAFSVSWHTPLEPQAASSLSSWSAPGPPF